MIYDFKDKVAVITGGGHGIGFATAQTCLDLGMWVVITASRQSSIDEAVARLDAGDRVLGVASDAADPDANKALADLAQEQFGGVHLLCLNAGVSGLTPIHTLTPEVWRKTIGVNLDGPFYGVHAFLPLLETQDEAHVVITSSVFGLFATGFQAPYFASKAGVTAFAESLLYDLMSTGSSVGVSVVLPGNTRTNMAEAALTGDEPEEFQAAIRAELAQGDDPRLVADAMLDAVRTGTFYVLPNTGDFQFAIDARAARIAEKRNPTWEDVGETI